MEEVRDVVGTGLRDFIHVVSLSKGRPGDLATCYADPSKPERELGWKASRDIRWMVRDA